MNIRSISVEMVTINNNLCATIAATKVVQTLVVFDSRLEDIATLNALLLAGSIGFTITASADGIETITTLLSITGARRLAIVAHCEAGVVHLGSGSIDLAMLQARSGLLQEWAVESIDLYGYEVAKGDVGGDFVRLLAELTGATVTAATANILLTTKLIF